MPCRNCYFQLFLNALIQEMQIFLCPMIGGLLINTSPPIRDELNHPTPKLNITGLHSASEDS